MEKDYLAHEISGDIPQQMIILFLKMLVHIRLFLILHLLKSDQV